MTNWAGYDAALRQRGSLTVWFSEDAIQAWRAEPRRTPGGQPHYSALAISTALTLRAVFRLGLRQTEGLLGSILHLLGLELAVPDHTTLMWTATESKSILSSPQRCATQAKQTQGLRPAFEGSYSVVRRPKPKPNPGRPSSQVFETVSSTVRDRRLALLKVRSGAPLCPACRAADAAGHHG